MTSAAHRDTTETDKIGTITTKWDLCDTRYVKWQSAAVWILSGVALIIGLAYAGGRWGAEMESQIQTLDNRVTETRLMVQSVDTIKSDVKTILQEIRR